MADWGCRLAVGYLNRLFSAPRPAGESPEIVARVAAGEDFTDVLIEKVRAEYGALSQRTRAVEFVVGHWPQEHVDVVQAMLEANIKRRPIEEPLQVIWKGDADNPETVTRFEVGENRLVVEFAHPPAAMMREPLSA